MPICTFVLFNLCGNSNSINYNSINFAYCIFFVQQATVPFIFRKSEGNSGIIQKNSRSTYEVTKNFLPKYKSKPLT